ncbi:flippase-like domain-containing protein [Candidatus Woesearchaeota archaeon]|nr:flippase-like domain-containing protein [Candidatus Woesearchaeota archaeon]
MVNKTAFFAIKLIIGVSILAALLSFIGWGTITENLKAFDIRSLLFIIPVSLFIDAISGLSLKIMTAKVAPKSTIFGFFRYTLITQALSITVPGRIGELSMVYFYTKEKIPLGKGTAIFLLDKGMNLGFLCILGLMGLLPFVGSRDFLKIFGLLAAGGIIVLFFFFSTKGRDFLKNRLLKKYSANFQGFGNTLRSFLRGQKDALALDFLLTAVRWILSAFILQRLFSSFGAALPMATILITNSIVFLVSLVPLTIQGIGVRETAAVVLFGFQGVPTAVTASAYISYLIIMTIYTVGLATVLAKGSLFKNADKNNSHGP